MERFLRGILILVFMGLLLPGLAHGNPDFEDGDDEFSDEPTIVAEERVVKPEDSEDPLAESGEEESFLSAASIEETRKNVSKRVFRLANKIDSLFGDRRADDRRNKSTLRVGQRFWVKDGVVGADAFEANLNLYLPNLKRIEKKVEKSVKDTFTSPDEPDAPSSGSSAAAESKESTWDLNQESGIIVAYPIDYFLRLRVRRDFFKGKFIHSFYEQIGWSKKNEWEEKTSLSSDFAITRNLLFRFLNEKSWAMTNEVLGTTHGPFLLHQLSDISAISYDLLLSTLIEDSAIYSNRVHLGAAYRTQMPIKWIFLEVNPEIAWERTTNFKPLYNFYLKFEFVFGNI